jgi:GxxExxY protein
MSENEIATKIIGIALDIHRHFGPGLLESAYERALIYDLEESGFDVKKQMCVPYQYKKVLINAAFRIDIVVNDLVLIEIKSVEELDPVHFSQTLTYLRLTGIKLGLLINFNTNLLKNGIHRIANNL